jgi:hypothetical protein
MEQIFWMAVGGLMVWIVENYKEIVNAYKKWRAERFYERAVDLTKLEIK